VPPTERAFVSVIIPVLNDGERLARCLAALDGQDYPRDSYEVIVVDNGSTELGIEPPASLDARIVQELRPGSYAARNHGLSLARGEIIAFTDADCLPAPDWLTTGAARLQERPDVGLLAGRIDVTLSDARHPRAIELYELLHAFPQQRYVEEMCFGATANVFSRREVFDRTGLFDASLRSGGDKEWGQRVCAAGYEILFDDRVSVRHPARTTWAELRHKLERVLHGDRELRRRGDVGVELSTRRVLRRMIPPARSVYQAWSDPRLCGTAAKVKYAYARCAAHYLSIWAGLGSRRHSPDLFR
jgi:glycosyltransferase involved in cell wall biosynthesis